MGTHFGYTGGMADTGNDKFTVRMPDQPKRQFVDEAARQGHQASVLVKHYIAWTMGERDDPPLRLRGTPLQSVADPN